MALSALALNSLLEYLPYHVDTLVLGCTHYPLLRGVISRVAGRDVRIVDSASSVAGEVASILEKTDRLASTSKKPVHRFFATDSVGQFLKVGERFLGRKIKKVRRAGYV